MAIFSVSVHPDANQETGTMVRLTSLAGAPNEGRKKN
jgi:hypothetical protein